MAKVALLVEYDGTRFAGFQRQAPARGPTVQGALEAAIERVTGMAARVEAAGRTDAGVHASGQVVSFRPPAPLAPPAWGRALNAHLPDDLAVRRAAWAADDFHARYSATGRAYRYRLLCDPARAPLRERYALRVARAPDVGAMDRAAAALLGQHDFAAFGSSPREPDAAGARGHCVRVMDEARCRRVETEDAGDLVVFDFRANAFLTGMVRRLVGTLLLVGAGRLSAERFGQILAARDKTHPGPAVAARGLCLVGVTYPDGALRWEQLGRI